MPPEDSLFGDYAPEQPTGGASKPVDGGRGKHEGAEDEEHATTTTGRAPYGVEKPRRIIVKGYVADDADSRAKPK